MAESIDIVVTAQPAALEDTLSALMDGDRFTCANDSETVVFWRVAVAAPASDAHGHALPPLRDLVFVFAAGLEKTWAWTRGDVAVLVITEEADS